MGKCMSLHKKTKQVGVKAPLVLLTKQPGNYIVVMKLGRVYKQSISLRIKVNVHLYVEIVSLC